MQPKALIAWSSGKDSAWALHEVRRGGDFEIVGALTTVTETFGRVSMHGVREELLAAQLDAAGLAPMRVPIPYPCPNEVYEARMAAALADAKRDGVTHVIFGDLFLEDVRRYREEKLAGTGIAPVFPLWGRPTAALAREMIDAGVETYLACVDLKQLAERVRRPQVRSRVARRLAAGRRSLRREGRVPHLRGGGPDAEAEDCVAVGEIVEREGFAFADLSCPRTGERGRRVAGDGLGCTTLPGSLRSPRRRLGGAS